MSEERFFGRVDKERRDAGPYHLRHGFITDISRNGLATELRGHCG